VLVSPPPAQHNKKFLRRFFQKAAFFLVKTKAAGPKACRLFY
jgi:hypothetical protein